MRALFLAIFTVFLTSGSLIAQLDQQFGEIITMDEFKEQVLEPKDEVWVLDFWASWCRPCIASMPHMKKIAKKYHGKKVRMVSLSYDETEYVWKKTLNKFQMFWTQIKLPDPKSTPFIDEHFYHRGIPTMFVVYPNGKVKKVSDPYRLEKVIDKAVKKI